MSAARSLAVAATMACATLLLAPAVGAHTGPTREARSTSVPTRPPEGPRGRIQVRTEDGGPVLRLTSTEGAVLAGRVTVTNVGDGPLTVRGVAFVPGEPGAPRVPLGASAGLDRARDGKLAPGETRVVDVRWRADQSRTAELMAHLQIDSDSAAPGADTFDPPALVGVVGDRRSGLGRVLSSLLVLVPLLVVAVSALAGRVQALGGRTLPRIAAAVFVVHAVLAAAATAAVDPRLSSADGNGGVQLVDHVALPGGLAWTVGLDGATAPFLVATALVVLAAAVAGRRVRLHGRRFFCGLGLLSTATFGAVLALDVRLLASFLVLGAPAAFLVVDAGDDPRARRAATGIAALVLASGLVLGALLFGVAAAAGPSLDLVRGRIDSTWSVLEMARVAWSADAPRVIGMHPGVAIWALGVAALILRAAVLSPLTAGAVRHAPSAASVALVGTALVPTGVVLVRLGFGPGATAVASLAPALLATGLVVAAIAAALAWRSADLARVAGATVLVAAGVGVAGLASRTPQGIEGAIAIFAFHGLAAALLTLVAASLRDRVGTSDGERLGGLSTEMPRASMLAGLAVLAAGALPGVAGFWGPALVVVGLVARLPLAAVAVAVVLVAQAAALARGHGRVFGGPLATSWRSSKELEPFAGRFPDLRARELLGAAPLAAALIVLGLHPRVQLAASETRVLELHRRTDPAGPTQVAGATLPAPCPSSTSSTSATPSCASDRAS